MYSRWAHWRDLKGECPVCGGAVHVGGSERTGRFFWLHDVFSFTDYYRAHRMHDLVEVVRDEFKAPLHDARARGLEPRATRGGGEAVSKRVRCVETGAEYQSIQAATDAVSRQRASLSVAVKRGGTCAGLHWELV
jgi:hypothetical protein